MLIRHPRHITTLSRFADSDPASDPREKDCLSWEEIETNQGHPFQRITTAR